MCHYLVIVRDFCRGAETTGGIWPNRLVENIARGLEELHCSLRKFAEITRYSQPRLAEILRGARQPGRYELALFTQTLTRMRQLQADVRADYGNVSVVWSPSVRDVLEARHSKGNHDYGVGIRHDEETEPQRILRVYAEREGGERVIQPTVLAGVEIAVPLSGQAE
jgi:hypothetical protein